MFNALSRGDKKMTLDSSFCKDILGYCYNLHLIIHRWMWNIQLVPPVWRLTDIFLVFLQNELKSLQPAWRFFGLEVTLTVAQHNLSQRATGISQWDSFPSSFCWVTVIDQGSSPYIQKHNMLCYKLILCQSAFYPWYPCNIMVQFAVTISLEKH